MNDNLEAQEVETSENEDNHMENPIRQNYDYGGNFLDKVKRRNLARHQRKNALRVFAQQSYEPGTVIKFTGGRFAEMIGEVVKESDTPGHYYVKLNLFGREVVTNEPISDKDFKATVDVKSPFQKDVYTVQEDKSDVPESIQQNINEQFQDNLNIALKPELDSERGYYVFPNYEFELYSASNDHIVKSLHKGYIYELTKTLEEKFSELIPVIRDAAVYAIFRKSPIS